MFSVLGHLLNIQQKLLRRGAFAVASFVLLLTPLGLAAQNTTPVDSRFQPWVGCWNSVIPSGTSGGAGMPTRACVIPSAQVAGSVDIVMYANDSILSRNALPLPGTSRARMVDDCTGQESSEWITGGTRLVLRGELTCPGNVSRVETGLMTMTPDGNWLQLQNLKVGDRQISTALHFRYDANRGLPGEAPAGAAVSNLALRLAAGSPYSLNEAVEVASLVPPALTEVWLAEVGLPFKLTGKTIGQLADRGVPSSVIDMMVALANPRVFAVRASMPSDERPLGSDIAVRPTEQKGYTPRAYSVDRCGYSEASCYGPSGPGLWNLGWGFYPPWNPYNVWSSLPLYSYDIYGRPIRYGSVGPYYGTGGVYYGGGPIVVITRPAPSTPVESGRYVKGQGYTPDRRSGSGASETRPATSSGSSQSGSGSTSGSSGSSSTGTAERIAKPRNPPSSL